METTVEREWLSYREAQMVSGLGRTKLWELVSSGAVPASKIGRSVRIDKEGLTHYLRSQNYADTMRK